FDRQSAERDNPLDEVEGVNILLCIETGFLNVIEQTSFYRPESIGGLFQQGRQCLSPGSRLFWRKGQSAVKAGGELIEGVLQEVRRLSAHGIAGPAGSAQEDRRPHKVAPRCSSFSFGQ